MRLLSITWILAISIAWGDYSAGRELRDDISKHKTLVECLAAMREHQPKLVDVGYPVRRVSLTCSAHER